MPLCHSRTTRVVITKRDRTILQHLPDHPLHQHRHQRRQPLRLEVVLNRQQRPTQVVQSDDVDVRGGFVPARNEETGTSNNKMGRICTCQPRKVSKRPRKVSKRPQKVSKRPQKVSKRPQKVSRCQLMSFEGHAKVQPTASTHACFKCRATMSKKRGDCQLRCANNTHGYALVSSRCCSKNIFEKSTGKVEITQSVYPYFK